MSASIELPGKRTRAHYRFVQRFLGPLVLRLLGGWRVSGCEHIPAEGPALICPNHVSYLDPPVIGIASPRRCCYMAKASLFKIPLLGGFIRKSYSYPVDLDEGGRQAIRIGTTLLEAGELVVIFPEGTRSPTEDLLPGQPGAAFIAARAGAPVIPAAIWGTDVVLPMHARRIQRCPVHVRFGAPMQPPRPAEGERLSREQLQGFTDELMARIGALRQEIETQAPRKWLERAERFRARRRAAHEAAQAAPQSLDGSGDQREETS